MKDNDLKTYRQMLDALQFKELEYALGKLSFGDRKDAIHLLAYNSDTDESNLTIYTFLQSLLYKHESVEVHFFASQVMAFTLNHVDKAELIGLFHALRASELDPQDADILEYLLYFNHIPEKLLGDGKAIEIAKQVILKKPESKAAQLTLAKLAYK
ncbi:hypothetical protein [Hufsiella ginkgonis]|uniref:HEAT repeat domain-containing protein n=1 Tax=Hufsiella ginkgonis TaxID=2695274 RepID=A0A7K1XTM9_9SPHI|nr:hypothetical protein [Hufsiella ginkgonis]MXV14178.1 hypothetical protein [Hufsiella ginkgonis]